MVISHTQTRTVQTFNFCTYCVGGLGMDAWMTSQLSVAFIHTLRESVMCLVHVWHVIHGTGDDTHSM